MGYRLRVPAEIGDWLAGLRGSEPAAAAEVAASLAALKAAEQVPRPPLTRPAGTDDGPSGDADPRELIDGAYRDLLEELQGLRRRVAAASRKRAELRVSDLTGQSDADSDELTEAIRTERQARLREEALAPGSERLQAEVDRFRTAKEVAKARYTAAAAAAAVRTALAEASGESDEAETAAAEQAVHDAAQGIEGLLADARAVMRSVSSLGPDGGDRGAARERSPSPDDPELIQLKADPLGTDIRILFALDPPGTATLLTVLEGPEAIAENWEGAATAAGMLLQVIRDAGWPPYAGEPDGGGQEFADGAEFLNAFFAANGDRIAARAIQLAERRSLADLRGRAGLSAADLAGATGISERRLDALERGDLRQATLHELTEYLRAVGATLDVSADLGGEQPRLS